MKGTLSYLATLSWACYSQKARKAIDEGSHLTYQQIRYVPSMPVLDDLGSEYKVIASSTFPFESGDGLHTEYEAVPLYQLSYVSWTALMSLLCAFDFSGAH